MRLPMITVYTYEEVLQMIKSRQGDRTAKEYADELGVSAAYLSDVYNRKRYPAEKILAPLKLKRTYGFVRTR